jgi:hypothetical protein
MDSQLEKMETCLGNMEAMDLETSPEEKESVAVHEEIPKEEAIVERFGAWKQHRNRHLAIRRRGRLKKQIQGNGGSWKKLASTCRGMIHHAIPARHKGHGHQGPGRDSVARGAPGGRTLERRQQTRQEGSNGIRVRDVKEQLRLRKETTGSGIRRRSKGEELCLGSQKTLYETLGQIHELEFPKKTAGTSVRLRKMTARTLWRGCSPSKRKKRLQTK